MKTAAFFLVLLGACPHHVNAQLVEKSSPDTILSHTVHLDEYGRILSWYRPDVPGAAFSHVAKLASEFIKTGTPVDPSTGKKIYFISCCFDGPHMNSETDFQAGKTWGDWMHNPACVFAGLTQSLVLDYRVYSGDNDYLDVVREMLDYQLTHGTTPGDWPWPNVPYASADPGDTVYVGAKRWEHDGMRGDGLHGIEPDKIGELGIAYLKFYEVTEEEKYLQAAIHCADALAQHVKDERPDPSPFSENQTVYSPWPFRVNARTGVVIDTYTSNVIEPIRLFDELLRIANKISLEGSRQEAYEQARQFARDWLFSLNGPMHTYVWNGYFEDVPGDPGRENRIQITPMETARYVLKHPALDTEARLHVPALLHYVSSAFATEGMDAIKEQTWCYEPMGSHTARYASINALWYEKTGEKHFKEEALRFFNLATYMTFDNGVVAVGPTWPGSWFSDGYGDYIRHFMEGLGAVPEWAPDDEDHLLRSSSVVQTISYTSGEIQYTTFDDEASEVLRITARPRSVSVNGSIIPERQHLDQAGWTWTPLDRGGVLRIRHDSGNDVKIGK